jgi:MFS family permease
MKATARMSSALQVARIAGPAFGGLVFGFLGPITSSSIVCILLFIGSLFVLFMKTQLPALHHKHKHASMKDELLSGAKFVFKHPILLPALSLDMISVLFGGVTALLPIFANDILMVGPKGLGTLRAAPAVGATLMSFYLARKSLKGSSGRWLLTAVAGFGACILVFGMSRSYILSLGALALSGAFDSISMLIRSSAVQLSSPDHLRGKISAVNSIFIGSSNELGELESGIAAKIFGTVPAVYLGGLVCLATVGLVAMLSPNLRNMDLRALEADLENNKA